VSARRRTTLGLLLGVLLLAAAVRIPFLTSTGLWVDEVFSLAIATGHSLEHPAAEARPELGDFVQGDVARPAAEWRAYLEHEEPAAPAARVLRATRLSDTSPPLYYLLLWGWTRALGTGDAVLRGFSLACSLLALVLLARLARELAGRAALVPACLLFALAPLSIHYGTEGRMYALLWVWVLAFASLTLALRRSRGIRPLLAWSGVAAAGFLTHYFFVFPWAALTARLFASPRRTTRGRVALGVLATLVSIAPWYAGLGASLARWRVTGDWLRWRPTGFARPAAVLELVLETFSGAEPDQWGVHRAGAAAALLLCAGALAVLLVARVRGQRAPRLAWAGLLCLAAWGGPLLFDAALGTYTVAVPRYAIAGLPAALLLVAAGLARLPRVPRAALLGALVLAWMPHVGFMRQRPARSWCPLREAAHAADALAPEVVVVHSIPSGLLGIARYARGPAPLAAWVEQLEERTVPGSLSTLAPGASRLALVRVHEVGTLCPLETWLGTNARVLDERRIGGARVVAFGRAPLSD